MKKSIVIDELTWGKLSNLKIKHKFKTMNVVIKFLLNKTDEPYKEVSK